MKFGHLSPTDLLLEFGISFVDTTAVYTHATNTPIPLREFLEHPDAGRLLANYLMFTQTQTTRTADLLEELDQ